MLRKKKIILAVTGSIAAFKSVQLLRELIKKGAEVTVLMSEHAKHFVAPLTFQVLSGKPVVEDYFNIQREMPYDHVSLAKEADLVIVAPVTANTIGKFASGVADNFLSTFLLTVTAPVIFAPAMNCVMYNHPIVQRNINTLKTHGVLFVEPNYGELACGDTGQGRLADTNRIISKVEEAFREKNLLSRKTIVVTAGPTHEHLDPVRVITNPSSGKMGYAIARAAVEMGGKVILISGPTILDPVQGAHTIRVRSAEDMKKSVFKLLRRADIIIMAAAVSDFRPFREHSEKTKKQSAHKTIRLVRNPDILEELGRKKGSTMLVGFAAETSELIQNSIAKMKHKNLDFIVANDISKPDEGFMSDFNSVIIIDREGKIDKVPKNTKDKIASILLKKIASSPKKK